jgi:uncharacterized protein with LGFP repeats
VTLNGNMDPITDYYNKLGAARGSYLSDPVSAQYPTADGGKAQDFRGGSIYWSAATGPHAVIGDILAHYKALGGPSSGLGYPITDELSTPDGIGRYNHFSRGDGASIYWSPNTGAHAIQGTIRAKWASMGWERGPQGYPITDELTTPDGVGKYNHFSRADGASIYWSPGSGGAWSIQGQIRDRWAALGWEAGPLGYPVTDELTTPDGIGRYNQFSKAGSIYWTASTGAHGIYGLIRQRWASMGWERSSLGYPTSDEYGINGGRRNDFVHGWITFWFSNGSVQVTYR